jgi:hypothetical protein
MEVQMSAITGEESDDINNLISARIKISGMLHSLSNAAAAAEKSKPNISAGFEHGQTTKESESFNVASSSINWNGGETSLQVPSLDNINADILHKWDQSLAIKPSVLTTDLTLVPIYELVDDESKRITLRSAHDDLLAGQLKVSSAGSGIGGVITRHGGHKGGGGGGGRDERGQSVSQCADDGVKGITADMHRG